MFMKTERYMILLCDVSGEDVGKPKNYYARFISYKMSVRF